jgi:hypothetical protein
MVSPRLWAAIAALVWAVAGSAQAHPGHALGEHGPAHIATSPYHLSILAGAGLLLWLTARLTQRPLARRLLQAGGLTAMLAAAVWWGVGM